MTKFSMTQQDYDLLKEKIARNIISLDSPLETALIKKQKNDSFTATLPNGDVHITILEIS